MQKKTLDPLELTCQWADRGKKFAYYTEYQKTINIMNGVLSKKVTFGQRPEDV